MYLLQRNPCLPLPTCGTLGHLPKALKRLSHQWKQGEILTWFITSQPGYCACLRASCFFLWALLSVLHTVTCLVWETYILWRPCCAPSAPSSVVRTCRALCDLPLPDPTSPCSPPTQCLRSGLELPLPSHTSSSLRAVTHSLPTGQNSCPCTWLNDSFPPLRSSFRCHWIRVSSASYPVWNNASSLVIHP